MPKGLSKLWAEAVQRTQDTQELRRGNVGPELVEQKSDTSDDHTRHSLWHWAALGRTGPHWRELQSDTQVLQMGNASPLALHQMLLCACCPQ